MIKPEGRGFNSHPGQSFPLSLCGPISICRANAHMVYGFKHQLFSLNSDLGMVKMKRIWTDLHDNLCCLLRRHTDF